MQAGSAENRNDDMVLDVLLDEWELQKAPLASVADVLCQPRRLLQSMFGVAGGSGKGRRSSGSGNDHMRKVARAFFVLRKTLRDIVKYGQDIPHESKLEDAAAEQP